MSLELTVILKVTAIFGVTALAVLALRRASASTRHMMWGIGFMAALILPFGLATLPVVGLPVLPPVSVDVVPAVPLHPSAAAPEVFAIPVPADRISRTPAAAVRESTTPAVTHTKAWGTRRLLGWFWVLGSLAALLRLLFSNWNVFRLKKLSTSTLAEKWKIEIEGLKRDLSVATPFDVRIAIGNVPPMTCGLLRQTILLPASAEHWTDERRKLVLAHELAHVKRRDGLTQIFVEVVCALYWFHPAVWLAARRMRLERERACDDVVLNLGVDADSYVDHLMGIVREINSGFSSAAISMAHPWQLESRLRAILDPRARRRTLSRLQKGMVIASGVLLAGGLSTVEPTAIARVRLSALQSDSVSPQGVAKSDSVSSQGVAKLEGTVLNAETGQPVAAAEVRLVTGGITAFPETKVPVGWPKPTELPKPPYSVTTDSSGRFSIQDIQPGAYLIGISAKGYSNYEVGQALPSLPFGVPMNIAPDSVKPLAVRLTPAATLSGRISNDERQPFEDVPVYLLRQGLNLNGYRRLIAVAKTVTSDSGTYEFTDVPWGPYYIIVGWGPSFTATYPREPYGWTFYPASSDAALATRIDARPGAILGGLDIFLKKEQSWRIRGTVIDSRTGKPPERAKLSWRSFSPFEPGVGGGGSLPYDPATGKFEGDGLGDGLYAIGVDLGGPSSRPDLATINPRDAWEQFEISGADRDDIVIHVPRSGYTRGRIIVEGNRSLEDVYPVKTPTKWVIENTEIIEFPGPRVWLQEASTLQPGAMTSADISNGTFEVPNVLSGRYRLQVANLPAGYYLKNVKQNGATVPDLSLDFDPETRTQIDITLAPGAGDVRGVVVNDRREPRAGLSGFLLPDPLPSEFGYSLSFSADQKGTFTLSNVPPGRYRIYVFDGLALGEFPVLDMYRRSGSPAAPVIVTEGSKLSITVGVIPVEKIR